MWNLLLAGIVGGVAYLTLKGKKQEESNPITPTTSKKKIVRSKKLSSKSSSNEESLTLLYEIQKDGFDYALRKYSTYPKIKDAEFHKLQKEYKKTAQALVSYIELKDPIDSKNNLSTADVLDNEDLDYGFLATKSYSKWKGVKDAKFNKLLLEAQKSYNELVEHLKQKYKIKNFSDGELDNAIEKLEGR